MKKKSIIVTYSDGSVTAYANIHSYKMFDNNIVIDMDLASGSKVYIPFNNVRSFEIMDK